MGSKKIGGYLRILISLGLLTFFIARTDIHAVFEHVASIPYLILLGAIALFFILHGINAFKWRLLLPHYPWSTLFTYTMIAQYYYLLVPGQMSSEIIKTYRFGKGRVDAERIVASVLVDRLTGTIGLMLIGSIGFAFTQRVLPSPLESLVIASIALICACLFAINIPAVSRIINRGLKGIPSRAPGPLSFVNRFETVLNSWKEYAARPWTLAYSILLGCAFNLICAMMTDLIAGALAIELSLFDWCWIFAAISLLTLLPFTIGGIGLREGAFIGILGWLGVPAEAALALSLTIFGVQIVGGVAGGMLDCMKS